MAGTTSVKCSSFTGHTVSDFPDDWSLELFEGFSLSEIVY